MSTIINKITRGNQISWTINFFDANNAIISANSATLRIVQGTNSANVTSLAMTSGPDGWVAVWDTSNTRPGIINWHASCEPVHSAVDGQFTIEANPANPGP